jgi:hypothetical protein
MREHGSGPTSEHGGEPVTLGPEARRAHGVDAAVDPVEAPGPDALGDPMWPKPEIKQLRPRDHPVLPLRERRKPHIKRGWGDLFTHLGTEVAQPPEFAPFTPPPTALR